MHGCRQRFQQRPVLLLHRYVEVLAGVLGAVTLRSGSVALIDVQWGGCLPSRFGMSYYSHIEETRKGTMMSTETLAPGWRTIPLARGSGTGATWTAAGA